MSAEAPPLKLSMIREAATPQSFERGERYYRQGCIRGPRRQGGQLWADCYGSEMYETSVTLNPDGTLAISDCTCPYDWGGICKHQVALLLTYLRAPEQFQVIAPLHELLKDRSHEQLLALIQRMLQQHPDLYDLLQVAAAGEAGQSVNLAAFRQQVARALDVDDDYETDVRQVERSLATALDLAAESMTQGAFSQAGDLYSIFLTEMNAVYNYSTQIPELDYDGDLAVLANDACDQLAECLAFVDADAEAEARQRWLTALWQGYYCDLELGGRDYAADSSEILCQLATDAEWSLLEVQIRRRLESETEGWARRGLVNLLQTRYEREGRVGTAQQVVQELGTPEQQVEIAMANGDYKVAAAIATDKLTHLFGLIERLADQLLAAEQSELALRLVLASAHTKGRSRYGTWLARYYRRYGTPDWVLDAEVQAFTERPSVEAYQNLRSLVLQQSHDWATVRDRAIAPLVAQQRYRVLAELALEADGDCEAAANWARQLAPSHLSREDLFTKIAGRAAQQQPATAIALYQELAEQHIEAGNRKHYAAAVRYLRQGAGLAADVAGDRWSAYLEELRSRYSSKRAFQDELRKAKLV